MVMPLHEGRYRSEGVTGPGGGGGAASSKSRAFKATSSSGSKSGHRGNLRRAQIFAVEGGGADDGEVGRRREEDVAWVDSDLLTRTSWTDASVALSEIRKVSYGFYPSSRIVGAICDGRCHLILIRDYLFAIVTMFANVLKANFNRFHFPFPSTSCTSM